MSATTAWSHFLSPDGQWPSPTRSTPTSTTIAQPCAAMPEPAARQYVVSLPPCAGVNPLDVGQPRGLVQPADDMAALERPRVPLARHHHADRRARVPVDPPVRHLLQALVHDRLQ